MLVAVAKRVSARELRAKAQLCELGSTASDQDHHGRPQAAAPALTPSEWNAELGLSCYRS